jgi:hypothetical protein
VLVKHTKQIRVGIKMLLIQQTTVIIDGREVKCYSVKIRDRVEYFASQLGARKFIEEYFTDEYF